MLEAGRAVAGGSNEGGRVPRSGKQDDISMKEVQRAEEV